MLFEKTIERRNKDAVMGLGEHLDELRRRVFMAVIGFVPVFLIALYFGERLVEIATRPVRKALMAAGEPPILQQIGALEAFSSYIKLSAIVTLIAVGPWVIYQAWKFVAPGLYAHERRFMYILAPFSSFMAAAGVAFCYFVAMPVMFNFLIAFSSGMLKVNTPMVPLPADAVVGRVLVLPGDPPADALKPGDEWVNTHVMERRVFLGTDKEKKPTIVGTPLSRSGISQQYRVADVVDLFVMTSLATAVGFQTPVVVLLLGWVGLVNPATLSKYRKHAICVCAVLGAVLTPSPDPGSMVVIALPMYLLYELGLVLVILLPAKRVIGKQPSDDGEGGGP